MNHNAKGETKKSYLTLAAISAILLLSSVLVVPTLNAYADHDNGNGKSKDKRDDHKEKDRKGPHEPKRCEHGASGKYNKHCKED